MKKLHFMPVFFRALGYFGLVFGVGFLLGPIRVLVLEPRVGTRWAELIEMPIMLTAIGFVAAGMVRRSRSLLRPLEWVAVGQLAMIGVLAADLGVGVWLRHLTAAQVFTQRDPVSGAAYYGLLLVFGGAPWWFHRRQSLAAGARRRSPGG